MDLYEIDVALAALKTSQAAREGLVSDGDEETWLVRRDRRDASGSYQELERCISLLSERQRRSLQLVYDFGIPISGEGVLVVERQAVQELSRLMPARIKVPKHHYQKINDLKKQLVKVAWASGKTLREISRYVGAPKGFVLDALALSNRSQ